MRFRDRQRLIERPWHLQGEKLKSTFQAHCTTTKQPMQKTYCPNFGQFHCTCTYYIYRLSHWVFFLSIYLNMSWKYQKFLTNLIGQDFTLWLEDLLETSMVISNLMRFPWEWLLSDLLERSSRLFWDFLESSYRFA